MVVVTVYVNTLWADSATLSGIQRCMTYYVCDARKTLRRQLGLVMLEEPSAESVEIFCNEESAPSLS